MERRQFTREFKFEAVRLIEERGVSHAQGSADLGVHPKQLRSWVKQLADDPQHPFPGHVQMKPEQLEIAQLKREVAKLKAERDILKNFHGPLPACAHLPRFPPLEVCVRRPRCARRATFMGPTSANLHNFRLVQQ
jgi:transposase